MRWIVGAGVLAALACGEPDAASPPGQPVPAATPHAPVEPMAASGSPTAPSPVPEPVRGSVPARPGALDALLPPWTSGEARIDVEVATVGAAGPDPIRWMTAQLPNYLICVAGSWSKWQTFGQHLRYVPPHLARVLECAESSLWHETRAGVRSVVVPVVFRVDPKASWGHLAWAQWVAAGQGFHVGIVMPLFRDRSYPAHAAPLLEGDAIPVELTSDGARIAGEAHVGLPAAAEAIRRACAGEAPVRVVLVGSGQRRMAEVFALADAILAAGGPTLNLRFEPARRPPVERWIVVDRKLRPVPAAKFEPPDVIAGPETAR